MTSEHAAKRRFPFGMTLAAVVVFAILIGLGVWQLQRLEWKHAELARIAEVQGAAAQPIAPVLARAAAGKNVSFTPVVVRCAPEPPSAASLRMTTDHGQWVARVLAACRLAAGPYDGVVVDRGFLAASRGQTNPRTVVLPAPATVWGELFPGPAKSSEGLAQPAPYVLSASRESPPAPGVDPAPYPVNASNLQYVGAYAPTWFGLAAVLVGIYSAALWRRYHPK